MPTYILDLLIRRAQLKQACNGLVRPVWLMVKSDGVHQAFNTNTVSPSQTMQFESPARLILNIQNIKESVLQVSLCTLDESYHQTIVVASSQILLSSLPFLNPKTISFPLMSTRNMTQTAAIVTMTATISLLPSANDRQKSSQASNSTNSYYPNSPQQSRYSNHNPYNSYQYEYEQQDQEDYSQQQMDYPQQSYQYNQEPPNQYYPQQYQNQPYRQPPQSMPFDMPVNPYKMQNSQNPSMQKKVRYPPFPPIQPPESSVLYNVDGPRQNPNQRANTPKVIHTKRGKR